MRTARFVILLIVIASALHAQDIPPRSTAWIRLESEPPGAEVWRGDSLAGVAPMSIDGRIARELTVYSPVRNSWNSVAKKLPDSLIDKTKGVIVLVFGRESIVRSIPSDAAVYRRDEYLGRTPMRVYIEHADTLTIAKPGYEPVTVLVTAGEEPKAVYLTPDDRTAIVPQSTALEAGFRLPPIRFIAGCALGVGAGVAAVVLKQEADRRYDMYRQGDTGERQKAQKFDIYSGVALAVMEAALLYLLIELFDNS